MWRWSLNAEAVLPKTVGRTRGRPYGGDHRNCRGQSSGNCRERVLASAGLLTGANASVEARSGQVRQSPGSTRQRHSPRGWLSQEADTISRRLSMRSILSERRSSRTFTPAISTCRWATLVSSDETRVRSCASSSTGAVLPYPQGAQMLEDQVFSAFGHNRILPTKPQLPANASC